MSQEASKDSAPFPLNLTTLGLQHVFSLFEAEPEHLLQARYRLEDILGNGNSATTYLALDTFTGEHVAIKTVIKEHEPVVRNEIQILRLLASDSDFVRTPRLIDTFFAHEKCCVVLEAFRPLTPLRTSITMFDRVERLRRFAFDICIQLCHLNKFDLLHADVKLTNVMQSKVDDGFVLIDYGNALSLKDLEFYYGESESDSWELQTAFYRAPEVYLRRKPLIPAIDYWSLGISLLEFVIGEMYIPETLPELFDSWYSLLGPLPSCMTNNEDNLREWAGEEADRETKISSLYTATRIADEAFLDFLAGLLEYQPEQRLQGVQCLLHPFLRPLSPILSFIT